jgi:hypothetical protein
MASQSDVLKAESAFFSALVKARIDELERLLTDDFSLADLSGGLMSKAALIQAVGSGQLHFEAIEPIEAVVRFYGTAAIVTGRTRMHGRFGETAFSALSRYTHVYAEQEGTLRLASAQGTPIAAA